MKKQELRELLAAFDEGKVEEYIPRKPQVTLLSTTRVAPKTNSMSPIVIKAPSMGRAASFSRNSLRFSGSELYLERKPSFTGNPFKEGEEHDLTDTDTEMVNADQEDEEKFLQDNNNNNSNRLKRKHEKKEPTTKFLKTE